ncbi:MAG: hypothetical protein FWE23_09280 [Chitinivibrionia bacterium]|nr:hypothetical protein [Chitinivibrionia bacterium]
MKKSKLYGSGLAGLLLLFSIAGNAFACSDGVGANSFHAYDNFLHQPNMHWLRIGNDHREPFLCPLLMSHSLFANDSIDTRDMNPTLPIAGISGTAGIIRGTSGTITKRGGIDACGNPAGISLFQRVHANIDVQSGGEVQYALTGTGGTVGGSGIITRVPVAYSVMPRFPDIRPRLRTRAEHDADANAPTPPWLIELPHLPGQFAHNPNWDPQSEFEPGPGGFVWPDTTIDLAVPANGRVVLEPGVHYFRQLRIGANGTLDVKVEGKNTRTIIYLKGNYPTSQGDGWRGRDAIRQGTGKAVIRTVDINGNEIPFTCEAEHGEVLIIALGCIQFVSGGDIEINANLITMGTLGFFGDVVFKGQAIAQRIVIANHYDAASNIVFRAAKTFALSVPAATFGEHPNWAWRTSGCEHDSDPVYYPSVIHGVGQGTPLEERPVIPGGSYDTSIVVALPANEQVEEGHIDVRWTIPHIPGVIEPMSAGTGSDTRVLVEGTLSGGNITGTFRFTPTAGSHTIKLRIIEGNAWRPDLTFDLDFEVLPTTSEDNKLNPFPTTITVKSDRGCSEVEICIPVDNITGVPTQKMVGETITLTGTVEPDNADNKTIVWSVLDTGGTGAQVNGNLLTTTTEGTLTVLATIKNGKCENGDFEQDFKILVHRQAIATVVNFVVDEAVYLSGSNPADGLIDTIRIRFSLNSNRAFEVSEEQIRELVGENAERSNLPSERGFTVNSADISVNSNSGLININVSQSVPAKTYRDSNDVISISYERRFQILPDSAMVIQANVSRFNIADNIAPIIAEAWYIFGDVDCEVDPMDRDAIPDTLRIAFSERIQRNISNSEIETVRGHAFDLLLDEAIWENDYIVKIPVRHDNSFRHQTDDLVFISENSGIMDIRGNVQNFRTQPVILRALRNQPDYVLVAFPNPWSFDDRSRGNHITVVLRSCSRNVDMYASSARITVFDRLGNAVSNTWEEFRYDENKQGLVWTWSGQNRRGRDVAAGVYKAIVKIPGYPDMSIMLGVARGRARE